MGLCNRKGSEDRCGGPFFQVGAYIRAALASTEASHTEARRNRENVKISSLGFSVPLCETRRSPFFGLRRDRLPHRLAEARFLSPAELQMRRIALLACLLLAPLANARAQDTA